MIPRRGLLVPALLLLAGCGTTEPALDLVPHVEPEEPALPSFRWEASYAAPQADPKNPLELRLPLPASTHDQAVHSLSWELGPPGAYRETTDATGDRVLLVRAQGRRLLQLRLRARFAKRRPSARGRSTLPQRVATLDPTLAPPAWVAAAKQRGARARLVHGVTLTAQGKTLASTWPEIVDDGDRRTRWVAVDLAAQRLGLPVATLRLGTSSPQATQNGRPVVLQPTYLLVREQ